MRRIWSLPATQRAPAPAAMLEERPSVPMVATTGEGRTGASDPGEAVVAGAVDAVPARGSSVTARPATATPASNRTSVRIAATQRRLGLPRRRAPAGAATGSGWTAVPTPAACPSPAAGSGAVPAPPGITRSGGGEEPPGITRRGRGGRSGRTTPSDPPCPGPSPSPGPSCPGRWPTSPGPTRTGRRAPSPGPCWPGVVVGWGGGRCRAWAGSAAGQAPEGSLVPVWRAASPAHVRRRHGPVRPPAPRCGAPGRPPARRRR